LYQFSCFAIKRGRTGTSLRRKNGDVLKRKNGGKNRDVLRKEQGKNRKEQKEQGHSIAPLSSINFTSIKTIC
jgi:hypothetical protein